MVTAAPQSTHDEVLTVTGLEGDEGLHRLSLTVGGRREGMRALEIPGDGLERHWQSLTADARARLLLQREQLAEKDVRLLVKGDANWPRALSRVPGGPLYLFAWGKLDLLCDPAIGMCGSRAATDRGLAAARNAGELVARSGRHIISGYARGVDTETHLAALATGAGTVIVLAEGILNFTVKRAFRPVLTPRNVLVVSQFPPTQRWTAGGAMARNGLICALGDALVVVEARERGGTLDAGRQALRMGKPVLALQYDAGETPVGNQLLFGEGARRIRSTRALAAALDELAQHA